MDDLKTKLKRVNWVTQLDDLRPPFAVSSFGFFSKGENPPPLSTHVTQIHGNTIVHAADATPSTRADGLFSDVDDACLLIKTADCLPVLVHSPGAVAALHAGWRGLASGILMASEKFFLAKGISTKLWTVLIGPAICDSHFEVGPEVLAAFSKAKAHLSQAERDMCSYPGRLDRWHFDLKQAAVIQLLKIGVPAEQIYVLTDCTVEHPEKWHSYRRDGEQSGRIYSWIRKV